MLVGPKRMRSSTPAVRLMAGPGVREGAEVKACSTLDLAPTMLALMGLPIPDYMPGRVLSEALTPDVKPIRNRPSGEAPAERPASLVGR